MADNPFFKTKEAEYKLYAIAFLQNLKYLDYELIDEETRSMAKEKHKEEVTEQEAQKSQEGGTADEQEKQGDQALKDAKIDCTVGMIARIIREDNDSRMLSSLPKFQETLAQHEQNIEESTSTFQHDMKARNKEKLNTIVWCETVLRTAEQQAEQESIALLDNFAKLRKHKFRALEKQGADFNFAAFRKELNGEIDRLEEGLLDIELKLQESLQESTTNF